MAMAGALALGIDIGGTKVAAALVDPTGAVVAHERGPVAPESNESALASITTVVDQLLSRNPAARGRVTGIGAGAPGGVDPHKGILVGATNLAWHNLPLGDELTRRYGVPTVADNDVNVAAWGERCFGGWGTKDTPIQHLVFITVGTGIGSGLIESGRIVRGKRAAGEIGHIPVLQNGPQCRCGMIGCLEGAAAGPAFGAAGRRAAESGQSPLIAQLAGGPEHVTAAHVVQAAVQGDSTAKGLLDREGYYLALAVMIASRMLDPEVIVFGGGLTEAGQPLFDAIRRALREIRPRGPDPETYVVPSRLGPHAGAIGAAALVLQPESRPDPA